MVDFKGFNEKAIKVIMLAQEEARRLGHNWVGTEQILLGFIGEGTGVAAKVLKSLGVNLKDSRIEVEKIIGRGVGFVATEIPFTPRANKVLELSLEEARQLGHNYIGTEHLLLGLITLEDYSVAERVLENLNIDLNKVRPQVIKILGKTAEVSSGVNPSKRNLNDIKNKKKQSDKEFDNNEESDLVSQLERLASLKERGLLTNKEFVEAKRRLLF